MSTGGVALMFGPPETAAVMVLTFSAMIRWGGKWALKSVVAILLGFIPKVKFNGELS